MRSSPEKSDRRVGAPTCRAGAAAPPIPLWSPSSIPTHPKKYLINPHSSINGTSKASESNRGRPWKSPALCTSSSPRQRQQQHAQTTTAPPPQQLLLGGGDAITSMLRSAAHHASRHRIGRRGIGRYPALPARSEERTARIGGGRHGEGAPILAPLLGAAGRRRKLAPQEASRPASGAAASASLGASGPAAGGFGDKLKGERGRSWRDREKRGGEGGLGKR